MTIATIEADIKEVAEKIGVEADHLAHLIRTGLHNLLTLHKEAPETAKQIVADAQPITPPVGNETGIGVTAEGIPASTTVDAGNETTVTGGAETTAG